MAICYLDWIGDMDHQQSDEIRKLSPYKNYVQLKHNFLTQDLFLIDRLIVENQGETPVRTLVIYSHLDELNYASLPPIMQKGNKLHELADL